jgi:hypothetical protein
MVLKVRHFFINEKTGLLSNPSFPNFLLENMDTIFTRQVIYEVRVVSWHATIGTKDLQLNTVGLPPLPNQDIQVIWET